MVERTDCTERNRTSLAGKWVVRIKIGCGPAGIHRRQRRDPLRLDPSWACSGRLGDNFTAAGFLQVLRQKVERCKLSILNVPCRVASFPEPGK
jgi:hypothetical protein